MYFGFCPRNLGKMTKNEVNVFYNVFNIYLLYDNLCNLNLYNNQWFCTHLWLYNFNMYLHLYSFNLLIY